MLDLTVPNKREREDTDGPSTKRRLTDRSKPDGSKQLCIFCGAGAATSEALHEFTTFNANRSVSCAIFQA